MITQTVEVSYTNVPAYLLKEVFVYLLEIQHILTATAHVVADHQLGKVGTVDHDDA